MIMRAASGSMSFRKNTATPFPLVRGVLLASPARRVRPLQTSAVATGLRRATTLLLLWPGTAAALPVKPHAQPPLPAAAQAGRTIYFANCVGCHGLNVQGGVAPSIRQAGKAPLDVFKRAVLQGKGLNGRSLNMTMPRYTGGFRPHLGRKPTDTELRNVQLYLRTLR